MRTISIRRCFALILTLSVTTTGVALSQEQAPEPPPAAELDAGEQMEASENSNDHAARPHSKRTNREAVVVFGREAELRAGDSANAVVVIGGSARINGHVRDAVVSVGGDIQINTNAEVGRAIAVLGNISAAPQSVIQGEAVAVGGVVDKAEDATIYGIIQDVDIGGGFLLPRVERLRGWFNHCLMMLRPLAPQVGWVWVASLTILAFYFLVAALFPRPIAACVEELNERPATTFVLGLLTNLLAPMIVVLLSLTVFGLLAVPFIIAALVVGLVAGKVAVLQWIGFRAGRPFDAPAFQRPMLALTIGAVLVSVLYMVPVLGLLSLILLTIWGVGAATTAAFVGLRRERGAKAHRTPSMYPETPGSVPSGYPEAVYGIPGGYASFGSGASAAAPVGPPPVLPESLSLPRAGFWERVGAAFLDVVLLSIIGYWVGGAPFSLIVALAYFAAMWTWRGTTIGGIVVGLKVVRLDGQPVTFPVALVRGLAAAFSTVVLFLGFLWIAWDPEKQAWHDKIAGTVVVRQPRPAPLVCV